MYYTLLSIKYGTEVPFLKKSIKLLPLSEVRLQSHQNWWKILY